MQKKYVFQRWLSWRMVELFTRTIVVIRTAMQLNTFQLNNTQKQNNTRHSLASENQFAFPLNACNRNALKDVKHENISSKKLK